MADKQTKLSIVIRTVDQATAKLKAISARLDAMTKPFRDFKAALGDLREKSGLDSVIGGFKGVGSAVTDLLGKVLMLGGVVGGAVAGLFHLVDGFDELGDKAEHAGVSVDFLAQMRYAAERSGVEVQKLDTGLLAFSKSLGQARAGTGRMASFLNKVSPALLKQLKAAKGNEEAFDLLSDAMAKIEDPAKRAALAAATVGDPEMASLLVKGSKGVGELRDRYLELAGSQEGAAGEAGKVDDAMKDLKASTDGIKAALVEGLAPALTIIVGQLREWLSGHRADIKEWAASLGKKLPAAMKALVDGFRSAYNVVVPFIEKIGGLKTVAIGLAAILAGPLISAIVSLGVALLTTPIGWIVAGIAAVAGGVYLLIDAWDSIAGFFVDLWDTVKGAFGAFFDWVKDVFLTYTPLGLIIEAWGPLKDFFVELWDGITGVFREAWDFITGIVDKVSGAVDTIKDSVGAALDYINPFSEGDDYQGVIPVQDVTNSVLANLKAIEQQSSTARVSVDFANAPRGTRVSAGPKNTAAIDFTVGYQMGMP